MPKKNIKAWFQAVRRGDLAEVAKLMQTDKAYLAVCNFAPPKKDDGQSGLQVAFKTGQFAIAELLIENGADVNFQETSMVNVWTAPVLHDCIRATIFNTYLLQPDTNRFDQAITLLQLLLQKGANPHAQDSYGNGSLHRALLDAKQVLDHPQAAAKQLPSSHYYFSRLSKYSLRCSQQVLTPKLRQLSVLVPRHWQITSY